MSRYLLLKSDNNVFKCEKYNIKDDLFASPPLDAFSQEIAKKKERNILKDCRVKLKYMAEEVNVSVDVQESMRLHNRETVYPKRFGFPFNWENYAHCLGSSGSGTCTEIQTEYAKLKTTHQFQHCFDYVRCKDTYRRVGGPSTATMLKIVGKWRGEQVKVVLLLHDNASVHTAQIAEAAACDCGGNYGPLAVWSRPGQHMAVTKFLVCTVLLISSVAFAEESVKNNSSKSEKDILARHIFDFGLKLMNTIIEERGERNVALSPISIAGVLAMTMLGSVGQSYNEIVNQIGFSPDILANQRHHRYLGELLHTLRTTAAGRSEGGSGNSSTAYASGLFVTANARVRRIFEQYLETVYRASILPEHFEQPGIARSDINKWILEHTGGKIQEFLIEPLPASTRLVLVSALHFSEQWEKPFIPEFTVKMPFHTANREILVDQMLSFGHSNYIDSMELNCQMVVIPYNDSATSLYAIKPRKPKTTTLKQLLRELDAEKIEKLIELAENKTTVIRFPKMRLATKLNLRNALQNIGIRSMFTPGTANFALMLDNSQNETEDTVLTRLAKAELNSDQVRDTVNSLPNPGLYVDSILHQVDLNVDEYGTEAVAATAGILARSSERFIADSPFCFFIRNDRTKLVSFGAAVFDPTS
ncbi:Serine protease inhibitor 28Dc [Eumeta japonica]|uniref:Serine protease inhibitor 28Dc n=1 Tax=Eumeta variegata TaxID=151549 RepID=A0A4C1XGA6_EUMVA|nr:Serine protease inhibitor 28Dc [Eumeta japonica]